MKRKYSICSYIWLLLNYSLEQGLLPMPWSGENGRARAHLLPHSLEQERGTGSDPASGPQTLAGILGLV